MTEEQAKKLVPEKTFVMFAGAPYLVAGMTEEFGITWISIYDERPHNWHVDKINAESCEPVSVSLLSTCISQSVRSAKLGSTIHPSNEVNAVIELLEYFKNKIAAPNE